MAEPMYLQWWNKALWKAACQRGIMNPQFPCFSGVAKRVSKNLFLATESTEFLEKNSQNLPRHSP
jgi:hypothetical protein